MSIILELCPSTIIGDEIYNRLLFGKDPNWWGASLGVPFPKDGTRNSTQQVYPSCSISIPNIICHHALVEYFICGEAKPGGKIEAVFESSINATSTTDPTVAVAAPIRERYLVLPA